MNRREFLTLGTGAMLGTAALGDGAPSAGGTERLRIGVVSDIHVQRERCIEERIIPVFEYFRDRAVDAVLIPGDLTDWGWKRELEWLAAAWRRVFPNDRLPNGNKVERLFIYGNHDIEGYKYDYPKWETMPPDWNESTAIGFAKHRREFWEEIFGESWEPISIKEVKGYKFVLANYSGWGLFKHQEIPGIREFFAERGAELKGAKPFFYTQHLLLKNTSTPWCRWADNGTVTKILSGYPNCVAITGHTHIGLADDNNLWRGAFTHVAASSLWRLSAVGGRANSRVPSSGWFKSDCDQIEQMRLMPMTGQHGLVLHVFDDRIVGEKYDFLSRGKIGADWQIPWPPKPAADAERAAEVAAPRFPKDAKVVFAGVKGFDRFNKRQLEQVLVEFPNVGPSSPRAYDFEVAAEVKVCGAEYVWKAKRVFSETVQLSDAADVGVVKCVFAAEELPPRNVKQPAEQGRSFRFVVTPLNSFGRRGAPIHSAWTSLEKLTFPEETRVPPEVASGAAFTPTPLPFRLSTGALLDIRGGVAQISYDGGRSYRGGLRIAPTVTAGALVRESWDGTITAVFRLNGRNDYARFNADEVMLHRRDFEGEDSLPDFRAVE